MQIDWAALGIVAVVATIASVAFVLLLAIGIRLLAAERIGQTASGSTSIARTIGYTTIGLAGLLVLFGIYLIVPQFH